MRPILLSGHERSLTQIKYNAEGDLLFSCSKDTIVNVWFSHNGERLGTYEGHNGTVWTCDVDSTSTVLFTGSADNTLKMWKVGDGTCVKTWEFPTAVKRVALSRDDSRILAVTERRMGFPATLRIFRVNYEDLENQADEPEVYIEIDNDDPKPSVAIWSYLDKYIITGHEHGRIALWDPIEGEEINSTESVHEKTVTDIQTSPDGTYVVTTSKDQTAKIIDIKTLKVIKEFKTETPLNSAAIIPSRPYIVLGGGQEAMSVTTTSARQGHFEVRFWHRIFEEEVARVKGGFGPCNTIAVHPKCHGYSIGGEDGYVRVHHFDEDFFRSKPYGADMEPDD
ncbi:WD40 repeat-like protein [Atractiella rhizophila]|nr:WD40 repeat-like protein [Atractiella rhizophila]